MELEQFFIENALERKEDKSAKYVNFTKPSDLEFTIYSKQMRMRLTERGYKNLNIEERGLEFTSSIPNKDNEGFYKALRETDVINEVLPPKNEQGFFELEEGVTLPNILFYTIGQKDIVKESLMPKENKANIEFFFRGVKSFKSEESYFNKIKVSSDLEEYIKAVGMSMSKFSIDLKPLFFYEEHDQYLSKQFFIKKTITVRGKKKTINRVVKGEDLYTANIIEIIK